MTPPPPPLKFGQRQLFNDSFLSFLRKPNKSQLAPPAFPSSPDSQDPAPIPFEHGHAPQQRGSDSLGEKKGIWQDGQRLLDQAKDKLEIYCDLIGKDNAKTFRKEAAK